jgi:hypothetical protein
MIPSPERVETADYDSVSPELIAEITQRVKRERRFRLPTLCPCLVKLTPISRRAFQPNWLCRRSTPSSAVAETAVE